MRKSTFLCDYEITGPFPERADLHRFGDARVLLRLRGRPLGFIEVPVIDGRLDRTAVIRRMLKDSGRLAASCFAERVLGEPHLLSSRGIESVLEESMLQPSRPPLSGSTVMVAVCTRDRTTDLAQCLDALMRIEYPAFEVLVVDNAPTSEATERLVRTRFPRVRYVREPRPGLDWARNRAVFECRADILAFTDDDVIVDREWIPALARVFDSDPQVMAVTGLVLPYELETRAQRLFESYGGFGRGFVRTWYRAPADRPVAHVHGGTGKFGTGANMAYRRRLFDEVGGFDTALDVGTPTNGGGDLDMFFRVLKAGHTLVYEPAAIVRHRHRGTYDGLRTQITNNGIGFYGYLVRSARVFRDERMAYARLAVWWFWWWNLRRLLRSCLRMEQIPRDLIVAELIGSLRGIARYERARRAALKVAAAWPGESTAESPRHATTSRRYRYSEAFRRVDVSRPLRPISDVTDYRRIRLLVCWGTRAVGTATIDHYGANISTAWLRDAITQQLAPALFHAAAGRGEDVLWIRVITRLGRIFMPESQEGDVPRPPLRLDPAASVSIVVATRDRPADLERCLESLACQRTARRVEVIVVDNSPDSGIAAAVAPRFPGVRVVVERRPGLSYARNRGILAATGEIIATTDDDVVCPPDWIEQLVAPFRRDDVMIVTGNVLPMELGGRAERLFEAYGGLGRGWHRRIADSEWFCRCRRSVPTWTLGCTANAAFRARIFLDPAIGLMDEALGAGTPTGCSEDTYTFYRVLKAGYAIVYEPDAVVWHRHRTTMRALRRQIYSYSKGHVAYQLTTWLREGDRRALVRIGYELPQTYLRRSWARLRRRSDYPLSFIGLELLGTLAGPVALWRSRRRVRRLGPSGPTPRDGNYALHLENPRVEVTDA